MKELRSTVDRLLGNSVWERIDCVCERFEDAWQSGKRPRLEDYLIEVDELERAHLLRELIALDIDYRRQLGEKPVASDYQDRFPDLSARWIESQAGADRYQLDGEIGSGGMGTVLQGYDRHMRRDIALKMLRPEYRDQSYFVRRFLREAWISARLQHPGIVPIYELGEFSDRQPFFTMKLVRGRTLDSLLKERTDPNQERSHFLTLFVQVCQTMAYAHSQGVIHRDLKPANVMVGAFGEVQIMDWGVAKVLQGGWEDETVPEPDRTGELEDSAIASTSLASDTQPGQAIGTIAYMPPEQARGEIHLLDESSDVFGLGAILCEILIGQPPFRGANPVELLSRSKVCDHAEAMSQLNACGADQELLRLVKDCLAASREARPKNAAEVAERCKAYLIGQQESLEKAERERSAAEARAEEAKRTAAAERSARRWMIWAATTVMFLASVGLAATSWLYRKADVANQNLEVANQNLESEANQKNDALKKVQKTLDDVTEANREATEQRQRALDLNLSYRHTLYSATTNLAYQAWLDGHIARCFDFLDGENCKPNPDEPTRTRGWEWYYLRRLCLKSVRNWRGDGQSNPRLAFHPDGSRIAIGGDGVVYIWEVAEAKIIQILPGHLYSIDGLAYSPDGKLLVSCDFGGTIKFWSPGGEEIGSAHVKDGTHSVAFSPDGSLMALGCIKGKVRIWDPRSRREIRVLTGHRDDVRCVVFSPDGKWLASASSDRTVRLWPLLDAQPVRVLTGHTYKVNSVAFRPDGLQLASCSEDYTVRLWDMDTGKTTYRLNGHTAFVWGLAYSPDGRWLASASDDRLIKLWESSTGTELATLRGHTAFARNVRFHPDGRWLASIDIEGDTKFWDLAERSQDVQTLLGHALPAICVAFSPDSREVVTSGRDGYVIVWNVSQGRARLRLSGHVGEVWAVAFHPSGRYVASGGVDRTIVIWDLADKRVFRTLRGHTSGLEALAFSPDGRLLASASRDRTIKLWETGTGIEIGTLSGHDDVVHAVAFSPDGRTLASASSDRSVKLWDTQSKQLIHTFSGHDSSVRSVSFRGDGKRLASAQLEGKILIWDVPQRQYLRTLRTHSKGMLHVAYGPDCRLASAGDQTIKIWNPVCGQELLTLKGHRSLIYYVAFSPDGRWLATVGGDCSVQLRGGDQSDARHDDRITQELSPSARFAWHVEQARACLSDNQPSAIPFHLARLHAINLKTEHLPSDRFKRWSQMIRACELSCRLFQSNYAEEAIRLYRSMVPILQALMDEDSDSLDLPHQLAFKLNDLGNSLWFARHWETAKEVHEQALELRRKLANHFPANPDYRSELAGSLNNLALVYRDRGQVEEARRTIEEAIEHQLISYTCNPKHAVYRQFLLNHWRLQAEILVRQGDHLHAVKVIPKVPQLEPHPQSHYFAALIYAQCAALAEKDKAFTEDKRRETARMYADRAMNQLHCAVLRGFRNATALKDDRTLQPLRERADYKKLLADLEQFTSQSRP